MKGKQFKSFNPSVRARLPAARSFGRFPAPPTSTAPGQAGRRGSPGEFH